MLRQPVTATGVLRAKQCLVSALQHTCAQAEQALLCTGHLFGAVESLTMLKTATDSEH
jgi:hypothetical protein